jgi:glycosyltransferase involved in cell wall biosynthesis
MFSKIGILLATYNGEKYIQELLDSLLMQTYNDFVCYIHDDGSTDNTVNILKDYKDKYPEKICIVNGESTGGAKNNFMFLLNYAKELHPYIMFCDQDDVWLPNKIEKSLNKIKEIENGDTNIPCLVYSDMKVVDANLNVISESFEDFNSLQIDNVTLDRAVMSGLGAGCSMILNSTLARIASVKNTDPIKMHDWWVMMVASSCGRIGHIDEKLLLYRQHGDNTLGAVHVTPTIRILQRLRRVVTFQQYRVTKLGLYTRLIQLSNLQYVSMSYDKNKELIDGAINFKSKSKISKCKFILKHKLYQNSFSRYWTCFCA